MDYEKATVNGAVGPRFVNPSVVARPDSEVATGKDTTPRYVGEFGTPFIAQSNFNDKTLIPWIFHCPIVKIFQIFLNELYGALHFVRWEMPKVALA